MAIEAKAFLGEENKKTQNNRIATSGRPKWTRKGQRMIDRKNRDLEARRAKERGLEDVKL